MILGQESPLVQITLRSLLNQRHMSRSEPSKISRRAANPDFGNSGREILLSCASISHSLKVNTILEGCGDRGGQGEARSLQLSVDWDSKVLGPWITVRAQLLKDVFS